MRFLIELHVLVGQQMTSAPLVEYPESVVERQEVILDFVNDAIEAKFDYEKVCKWMKRCRIDENVHDSIFCKRKYSEAVRQNFELDLNVETRKLDKTATKSLVSLPADSRHLKALKKTLWSGQIFFKKTNLTISAASRRLYCQSPFEFHRNTGTFLWHLAAVLRLVRGEQRNEQSGKRIHRSVWRPYHEHFQRGRFWPPLWCPPDKGKFTNIRTNRLC